MTLAIGIDTGGTCTDAVLYDFETNKVLSHHKALTTYDDLSRGILNALDGLNQDLCRQATVVGLSTTLSTNACVEGKLRKPRLLLMGIDRKGIQRFGANYGFHDPDDICYLPCKTTITGQIQEEPDWSLLRSKAKKRFADAEGCAVCEIYAVRNNGIMEKKAASIIAEETGLPVVCSSSLFHGLSSLERAASSVLNAGLLPLTQNFLDAVRQALKERSIEADVFIVRSDSNLMSLDYSASHPVESLLSGPAASALGGSTLSGKDSSVIVDIGGTTTDVAIVENNKPLLSDEGIRVGQWKTQVKGLFASSFALGGDSAIRWDQNGAVSLGPERVIPLCLLASKYPQILDVLKKQVESIPVHSLPMHEFLTLIRQDWNKLLLTDREKYLCQLLEKGPLSLQQAADALGIDKYSLHTRSLEKPGIVLRAGLTPTDIMHIRGDYTAFDRRASLYAGTFAAASTKHSLEEFCDKVYNEMSHKVFLVVSKMLLEHASPYYAKHGFDTGIEELLEMQWENRNSDGSSLLQFNFHSKAVLIGIGGPVHLFLPEAAKALEAEYIIPECAPVANAVGAVTGKMVSTASAEIKPHGMTPDEDSDSDSYCDYEVLYQNQTYYFSEEKEAIIWLEDILKKETAKQLKEQGAVIEPTFYTKIDDITTAAYSGFVKISTTVTVTAESSLKLTQ